MRMTETVVETHGLKPRPAPRRVWASLLAAVATVAVALGLGSPVPVALLLGWGAAALVYLTFIWTAVGGLDAEATGGAAKADDASRPEADAVMLGAGTASLLAVGFTLAEAGDSTGTHRALLIALALVSVVLAWASVHTIYALRYARLYYGDSPGGIDFNDSERPSYLDFFYVALTVGMTSQVSDTSLTSSTVRRTAIRHALLSYLFATVVVALTINVVATLIRP
jgi:uncharacterized membrane protein